MKWMWVKARQGTGREAAATTKRLSLGTAETASIKNTNVKTYARSSPMSWLQELEDAPLENIAAVDYGVAARIEQLSSKQHRQLASETTSSTAAQFQRSAR